ncbi:MAG: UvrB/UvrC motif-containing protein [Spirochaetes bacterium]|nr:UvrB/UvrC motif-containing protein [Spirochaetota bacterium]
MKCEKCNHNEATIHLTEIQQNTKSELHLCEQCARETGIKSHISNLSFSLADVLSLFDRKGSPSEGENVFCNYCGHSLLEYKKTHSLGCPYCYIELEQHLSILFTSQYSHNLYSGNAPVHYIEPSHRNLFLASATKSEWKNQIQEIHELKKLLNYAITNELYEEAAILRDKIRELEKSYTR